MLPKEGNWTRGVDTGADHVTHFNSLTNTVILLYIKRDDIYIYIYLSVPFTWHHGINFNTSFRKNRERYKTEIFLTEPNALMAFKSVWKNRKLAKE